MMTQPTHEHLQLARQALDGADVGHAGHHIAMGLADAPDDADLLALFDEAFERSPDPLRELFPASQEMSAAAAAVHARALARSDQFDAAYEMLCLVAVSGAPQFLTWARTWPLPSAEALHRSLTRFLDATAPVAATAKASIVDRAVDTHPQNGEILTVAASVARLGGDFPTALVWARRAVAIREDRLSLSTLAAACNRAGDWNGACDAWARIAAIEPEYPFSWLDWADATLERGEMETAADRYNQALARDPGNAWASGSLAYLTYRRQPTARAWTSFRSWSQAHPDNARARSLVVDSTPWVGWLPNPTEVNFNAWSSLRPERSPAELAGLKMTASHLEGPSILYAMATHIDGYVCEVETIQSPDPRTPLFGNWPLWNWQGAVPQPALPMAPAAVQQAVHQLAAQPFNATRWLEYAGSLVFGLGTIHTTDLIACALHPTAPAPGFDEVVWFWRCQHAAAFLLAGIPTSSPTDGTIQALDTMLAVRQDWNATAALAALLAVAETSDELRNHVWGRCYEILYAAPNGGDFPTAIAAYWGLLRLDATDHAGAAEAACAWIDGG